MKPADEKMERLMLGTARMAGTLGDEGSAIEEFSEAGWRELFREHGLDPHDPTVCRTVVLIAHGLLGVQAEVEPEDLHKVIGIMGVTFARFAKESDG